MLPQAPSKRRALTPETLTELGRVRVRELCQVLLVERGLRRTRYQPRSDTDDLYVVAEPLWRARQGLMRVVHRPLLDRDVMDLAQVARSNSYADALLVEGALGSGPLVSDEAVHVIRAAELVARIQVSPLIEWVDGAPRAALERFALAMDLSEIAPALDPVGLRWLPSLALKSVPGELEGHGTANDLFEDIVFRILTTALRFDGRRLGAQRRGERLPDAVLHWEEDRRRLGAVLDCKAAQHGYTMNVDDERALIEYVDTLKAAEARDGVDLAYVVVVSSEFTGDPGDRHPVHARARSIAKRTGAKLTYLRAGDLVRLVIAVERSRAQPAARNAIAWSQLFDMRLPDSQDVAGMWAPD